MRRLLGIIILATALQCPAQVLDLGHVLSFETDHPGGVPAGWAVNPPGTAFADSSVVHGGKWSVRLERTAGAGGNFTNVSKSIPLDFSGKRIELRGYVRLEDVTGFAGFWIREDGADGSLGFDSMQPLALKGTSEWKEYSVSVPVHNEGRTLIFGTLLSGTGKAWADDLQLLVDGKPVWEAPKIERPKTVVETDRGFDAGSQLTWSALTRAQVENLATLGKVWGFLKYHHPLVTAGKFHWDYELFRVAPTIVAAHDRVEAQAALVKWIAGLGAVEECSQCAQLNESDLHLRPAVGWISSETMLGTELSKLLSSIYRNRAAAGKQFYVSQAPGVRNPVFEHELSYPRVKLPDPGIQLLALYRFWNIIEYWSPYRDVLGEDWDALAEFIPRIALARTPDDYQRELMALIARAHDTHANLWSSIRVRPPVGTCQVAVNLRFIEDCPVVAGYAGDAGKDTGLLPGDIVTDLDGTPVAALLERWSPYYAASNQPTRLRDIGRAMTHGECGEAKLKILRDSEPMELTAKRVPIAGLAQSPTHDLPGDTFRLLSKDIAYLKLSSVKIAEAPGYIDQAAGTKGLIVDIRNYPSQFVVFALGNLLGDRDTEFARFTRGDLANPGAFHWDQTEKLSPAKPHYSGKAIILVDEVSQSQAEYTSMALRSAPGAKVMGSTTAGADGNVSNIPLPGALSSMISGIGVFYPDKRPTQRIGIIPDIEVRPTIAGIRAGRDELMEAALREILGRDTPADEIEKLLKR